MNRVEQAPHTNSRLLGGQTSIADRGNRHQLGDISPVVVLVIDDELAHREYVKEILTAADFFVHSASNGADGLQTIREVETLNLITSDACPGHWCASFWRQI